MTEQELSDLFCRLSGICPECGRDVPSWWRGHRCPVCVGHPEAEVIRTERLWHQLRHRCRECRQEYPDWWRGKVCPDCLGTVGVQRVRH